MVNPWINHHHHHHREPPKPASFRSSSSKHRAGPDKQPAPARTSAKAERRMAPVSSMSVLPESLQTSVEDQIISVQIKPYQTMKNCETFETLGPWWICIWASGCYTADSGARFPFKTSICSRYNKPLHHTQRCVEHATAMLQRSLLGTDQDVVSSWCLSIDPGNDEMFQKSLTLVLRGRTQLDTRGLETGYRTS